MTDSKVSPQPNFKPNSTSSNSIGLKTLLLASAAIISTLATGAVKAAPLGGTVTRGEAAISVDGNTTTIAQTTDRAIIDWSSFNLASNEVAKFVVPSETSATLNRINNGSASTISGSVISNGAVYFANPNGLVFDATSRVTANGFFATTSSFATSDSFMNNLVHVRDLSGFNSAGHEAKIIVNGTINARQIEMVGPHFEFGETSRIESHNGSINITLTGSRNDLGLVNHGTIIASVGKNLLSRHNGVLADLGNISIQNIDIRNDSTIVSDGEISAATELTIYGGDLNLETLRGYLVDVKARYGGLTVKDVVANTVEIESSRSRGHYHPVLVDGILVTNYLRLDGGSANTTLKNATIRDSWEVFTQGGITINNLMIFDQSINDIYTEGSVSAHEINVGTPAEEAAIEWFKPVSFDDSSDTVFNTSPPATLVSYIDLINQRVQIVDVTPPSAPAPVTPPVVVPVPVTPVAAVPPAPVAPPAPLAPTAGAQTPVAPTPAIPQPPVVIFHAPIKPVVVVTTPPVVVVTPPPVVVITPPVVVVVTPPAPVTPVVVVTPPAPVTPVVVVTPPAVVVTPPPAPMTPVVVVTPPAVVVTPPPAPMTPVVVVKPAPAPVVPVVAPPLYVVAKPAPAPVTPVVQAPPVVVPTPPVAPVTPTAGTSPTPSTQPTPVAQVEPTAPRTNVGNEHTIVVYADSGSKAPVTASGLPGMSAKNETIGYTVRLDAGSGVKSFNIDSSPTKLVVTGSESYSQPVAKLGYGGYVKVKTRTPTTLVPTDPIATPPANTDSADTPVNLIGGTPKEGAKPEPVVTWSVKYTSDSKGAATSSIVTKTVDGVSTTKIIPISTGTFVRIDYSSGSPNWGKPILGSTGKFNYVPYDQ